MRRKTAQARNLGKGTGALSQWELWDCRVYCAQVGVLPSRHDSIITDFRPQNGMKPDNWNAWRRHRHKSLIASQAESARIHRNRPIFLVRRLCVGRGVPLTAQPKTAFNMPKLRTYSDTSTIRALKNRPDPPPEQLILQVLDAARQVEAVLSIAGQSTGLSRAQLLRLSS